MQKFCLQCASQLKPDARFCTGCGASVDAVSPASGDVVREDGEVSAGDRDDGDYRPRRPRIVKIAVVVALIAALAVGGYFGWSAWSSRHNPDSALVAGAVPAIESPGLQREMYAIADANVRDKPTGTGSKAVSKLMRGTKISGVMVVGADNETSWFKLTDGSGFVWAVNLSYTEPPVLSRILNSQWHPQMNGIDIRAQPDATSAILDIANIGHIFTVVGLTQNNFAEVKLDKGGVGYVSADMVNLAQAPSCESNLMQTQGYTFAQAQAQCAAATADAAAAGAASAAAGAASAAAAATAADAANN